MKITKIKRKFFVGKGKNIIEINHSSNIKLKNNYGLVYSSLFLVNLGLSFSQFINQNKPSGLSG